MSASGQLSDLVSRHVRRWLPKAVVFTRSRRATRDPLKPATHEPLFHNRLHSASWYESSSWGRFRWAGCRKRGRF